MRPVISNVLVLEVMNKIRQVSIKIFEFTCSIKQLCGRCHIKFMWQFASLRFQILLKSFGEMWLVSQTCELFKSLSKKRWCSQQEFLLHVIYNFSLPDQGVRTPWPDEGGENMIFSFSFFLFFWKFRLWQGGLSLYGHHKGARELAQIWCINFACLRPGAIRSGFTNSKKLVYFNLLYCLYKV